MKPVGITLFQGPNIHGKQALVRLTADIESLWSLPADELQRRVAERLPDTRPWQFPRKGLELLATDAADVSWASVLTSLARDLQNERFGEPLPVWSEDGRLPGRRDFLVGMIDPDIGHFAAVLAYRITHHLYGHLESADIEQGRQAIGKALQVFRQKCFAQGYASDTRILLAAARLRGVPVRKLVRGQRFALLGHGVRRLRMGQNASDLTSGLASRLSNDKEATWRLLRRAAIPVPRQRTIEHEGHLDAAVRDIGFPLVVKAATGSKGLSVTANIRHPEELSAAIAKAQRYDNRMVVEEHVEGTDYRLLIVNGRMIAAGRRRPGHVTGDGQHTIRELVENENIRRFARGGFAFLLVPLALDEEAIALLAREGLSADSIPELGREVRLRSTGNVAQGALPEDVTDDVHPDTVALAVRAARTIGLDIAGVDVLTTDITRPLANTGGVIIEINHFPGIGVHYGTETPPRDVAGAVIDYLFPAPARGRIPLVAVTGTNGKTTTCRMLQRVFIEAGYCTGLTTTSGSYVGSERVLKGDYANNVGAHSILQDPRVEAVVLETARGGIIKRGLGWDSCDVAVVTNISEDHLGHDGIHSLDQLAEIKGLIVELARKAVVLNADDTFCRALASRASLPVWWVSSQPEGAFLEAHLASGGNAILLMRNAAEERLVHCCGTKETEIVRVRDMPSSLDGLVRHNIENAMATSAAALAIGLPLDSLIKALTGYTLSFEDSPGRLNIHDVGGARVIIDYAHNVDSIDRIGRLLEQMPVAGRRLCMMSISTRRLPAELDQLAAVAAPFFDDFVVAGSFRHGVKRPVEETASLMGESLVKAGVERNRIKVEADEYRAIENTLKLVRPNDLLLLLAGRRHEFAWEKVRAMGLNDKRAQEGRADSDDAKREPPELDTARQTEAHAK